MVTAAGAAARTDAAAIGESWADPGRISGLAYRSAATDVSGRTGVAVARVDQGIRVERISDPTTYRHLGSNHVVVEPYGPRDRLVTGLRNGDRVHSWAVLDVAVLDVLAVVDKVGKRS